jgi:hypothetical protein
VNPAAGSVPNSTALALVKLVPATRTVVPPPVPADVGDTDVTVGSETALDVKWSDDDVLDVPLGVVTVIS